MSQNGFEDHQNDEPTPAIYQRRRIIALIIALLVILLILWGILALIRSISTSGENNTAGTAVATTSTEPFSDFSARTSASASGSESASAEADQSETATAETSESATAETTQETDRATEEPQASEEASPAETKPAEVLACTAADMQVSLTVDQNSYTSGQNPAIAVTYSNTSGDPCVVGGAGQPAVDINITSGPAQVYNYAQCQPNTEEHGQLAAGESATKVITWDRSINALGCGKDQRIQPGYYWVTATVNGVSSQPTRIIVSG